jgi:hypothetical protein
MMPVQQQQKQKQHEEKEQQQQGEQQQQQQQVREQAAGPQRLPATAVPCFMTGDFVTALRTAYQDDPKIAPIVQQLAAGQHIPPKSPGGPMFKLQDGVLYQVKGDRQRLYLPADQDLHRIVFDHIHAASHSGAWKTRTKIRKHCVWAGMKPWIFQQCRACSVCQALPPSLASSPFPPLITSRPWDGASVDLFTQPPSSSSSSSAANDARAVFLHDREASAGNGLVVVEGVGVFEAEPGLDGLLGQAVTRIPRSVYQSCVLRSLNTCMA